MKLKITPKRRRKFLDSQNITAWAAAFIRRDVADAPVPLDLIIDRYLEDTQAGLLRDEPLSIALLRQEMADAMRCAWDINMQAPPTQDRQSDRYATIRAHVMSACGPLPDGVAPPKLSNHALAQYARAPRKLLPLSDAARDMVLGTILGDASLGWTTTFPRYSAVHGIQQMDYCVSKLDLLRDYCDSTTVKEADNLGYGDKVVRFSTLSTPVFEVLRHLCYRPDPSRPSAVRKAITQELVEQLNWTQVAWWFQDDGCKQNRRMNFGTHAFPRDEVELLASWFKRHGVDARPKKVSKGKKIFWILDVSTAGAAVLVEKIRPFMHPSLLYKLPNFTDGKPCEICGEIVPDSTSHGPTASTCSDACRGELVKKKDREKFASLTPEQRKERYQKEKEALAKNPERREKRLATQRKLNNDPERRKNYNAWRKEHRRKLKATGVKEKPTQRHTCQFCGGEFENTATHKMGKRSSVIYCPSPDCTERGAEAHKEIRRRRAREKWAQKKSR